MQVVGGNAHFVPSHLLERLGRAPRRRDVVVLRAVVERLDERDVVHEVCHRVHVGNRRQIKRGEPLLSRLVDIGGKHREALLIVEHARVVEVGLARPTDHRHAHLLVGSEHDATARHAIELMERVEARAHVLLGERRHVRAHRQDAIGAAVPRLSERMVVMLVEARALVGEKHQLTGPCSRVGEQLLHHGDVLFRRGGYDELVFVTHDFFACRTGGLGAPRAFALQVGQGVAAYLDHVEKHAVVQPRGHFGLEHAVLQHRQAGLHQAGDGRLAEKKERVSPHALLLASALLAYDFAHRSAPFRRGFLVRTAAGLRSAEAACRNLPRPVATGFAAISPRAPAHWSRAAPCG